MRINNFNKIKSVIISSALLPLLSFARFHTGGSFGSNLFGTRVSSTSSFGLCYVIDIMNRFIIWAQVILFTLAVIMALWAAFLFIVKQDLTTAKGVLIYAAVGVGVALLAYAIVPLVSSFLGVSYYEQCF